MLFEVIPIKEKRYLRCDTSMEEEDRDRWSITTRLPGVLEDMCRYSIDTLYRIRVDKEWLEVHTTVEEKINYAWGERTTYKMFILKFNDVLREVANKLQINEHECLLAGSAVYYGDWYTEQYTSLDDFGDLFNSTRFIFCNTRDAKPIKSKKEKEHLEKMKNNNVEVKVINTMLSGTINTVISDIGMRLANDHIEFKNGNAFKLYVIKCIEKDLTEKLGSIGVEIEKINKPKTTSGIRSDHWWVFLKYLRLKKD